MAFLPLEKERRWRYIIKIDCPWRNSFIFESSVNPDHQMELQKRKRVFLRVQFPRSACLLRVSASLESGKTGVSLADCVVKIF